MPGRVTAVHSIAPRSAIEGGRVTIEGTGFPIDEPALPEVRMGDTRARVVYASPGRLVVIVPEGLEAGRVDVRIAGVSGATLLLDVAAPFANGLHQVDNPVFDRDGNLYVTYSGTRGQQMPVVCPDRPLLHVESGYQMNSVTSPEIDVRRSRSH